MLWLTDLVQRCLPTLRHQIPLWTPTLLLQYHVWLCLLCIQGFLISQYKKKFNKRCIELCVYLWCIVDKALPHAVSTDASLGSLLPTADAVTHNMSARNKSVSLDLETFSQTTTTDFTTLTAADAAASRVRRSARSSSLLPGTDVQVVVVWLESFEDYLTFPVGELLSSYILSLPHADPSSCRIDPGWFLVQMLWMAHKAGFRFCFVNVNSLL